MLHFLKLLFPLARRGMPRAHEAGVLGHCDRLPSDSVLAEREMSLWLLVVLRFHAAFRRRSHSEFACGDRTGRTKNHFFVMQPSLLIAQFAQALRQMRGDECAMSAGDMLTLWRQL